MPEGAIGIVCAIVGDVIRCPPETISAGDRVGSLAGWDSIAHVNILLAVEARAGRRLDPAEIASVATVGDLARILEAAG
jgi:acyl carrier protein